MSRFRKLDEWLRWQEGLHPKKIDLGLERVASVWRKAAHRAQLPFRVITVAGTNGKGSCVAFLDAIYRAAGYRVGCFTSPHLVNYNERIRVDGKAADDELICAAFERIDQARGGTSITYFEFSALAALSIFLDAQLDVVVLEVGIG
ncbi:MAG TPA: bifunctional folylpolyglutamate synthase/dihydrofolate synthase, partial [Gammaproteobacteria bacterium]|nr:bifunctional folylpolyglutamate synthase/dihydrofolate synthase [Gammaproteobacteria bacterium]